MVALLAVCIAFCSATQDIAIDAYRIEAVVPKYQGAMAAMYVFGYRLALLVAGAGALYIAEYAKLANGLSSDDYGHVGSGDFDYHAHSRART